MSIAEKLQLIAENEQKVFNAGKKAEYDAFWDVFQSYGNRETYPQAFRGWKIEIFNPKYDFVFKGSNDYCFYGITSLSGEPFSITEKLQSLGRKLDTSKATSVSYLFAYYKGNHIPYLDFSNATTGATSVFAYASEVVTIEGIKLNDSVKLYKSFTRCDKLEEIGFDGTIATDIDLKDCKKLTLGSLIDILRHLKDFTDTGEEYTRTLTLSQESVDILNEDTINWLGSLLSIEKKWSLEVL